MDGEYRSNGSHRMDGEYRSNGSHRMDREHREYRSDGTSDNIKFCRESSDGENACCRFCVWK